MARFLWTQKQDIGPAPRFGHAMAFDTGRGRVVLFGGDSLRSRLFNDTWEWNGENWTQMADIGPSPRREHAVAYDAARRRVVLFGGASGGGPAGDTWEWDGGDWTQVEDSGPAPRSGHAVAFDGARNRVVLFGGESASGQLRDTWEWDGTEWTQQEDTGPSPRRAHAMAFDASRRRVALFGGFSSGLGIGDTWEWDGTTWTQVSSFGPDGCLASAMVSMGNHIALFGGLESTASSSPPPRVFGSTWEWDGRHWTQRQDIGPRPRWGHAMAYDEARGRIVLFGGLPLASANDPTAPDALLADTWEHVEGAAGSPPPGPTPGVTVASLTIVPATLPMSVGREATATVVLSGPAPSGGVTVQIQTNPASSPLGIASPLTVPAGSASAQFLIELITSVTAFAPGDYQVIARLGASTAVGTLALIRST